MSTVFRWFSDLDALQKTLVALFLVVILALTAMVYLLSKIELPKAPLIPGCQAGHLPVQVLLGTPGEVFGKHTWVCQPGYLPR